MCKTSEAWRNARRVGTPIVAINTADPLAVIDTITVTKFQGETPPCFSWDISAGLRYANEEAKAFTQVGGERPAAMKSPTEALEKAAPAVPPTGVLFLHNAHRYLESIQVVQAIWNLRDSFKASQRTLVLLGPDVKLPVELVNDVLVIDDPLPTEEALKRIVRGTFEDAGLEEPGEEVLGKAVAAVTGLPHYTAESAIALNLHPSGLDTAGAFIFKRQKIEEQQGLKVYRGKETFADIAGYGHSKNFFTRLMNGPYPFEMVCILEEVEKVIPAQGEPDTSQVKKGILGLMLSWMEDEGITGSVLVGVSGSGKSLMAKSIGNQAGVPSLSMDINGMLGGIVGSSEQAVRNAFRTASAMGNGRIIVIATSNGVSQLPPEFRARFKMPTFFYDLPLDEEREAIWPIHLARCGLDSAQPRPQDKGWVGRDIAACCDNARMLSSSIVEAAEFIVPITVSASKQIETLRQEASGRFVSASYPGWYDKDRGALTTTRRQFASE